MTDPDIVIDVSLENVLVEPFPDVMQVGLDSIGPQGPPGPPVADGDKGDITVSGGGTVWLLNNTVQARLDLGLGALAVLNAVDLSGTEATGFLAAARFPGISGDVTVNAGTYVATIPSNSINNVQLEVTPPFSFKGNPTGLTTAPQDFDGTTATSMLNVFTPTLQGLVPPSGSTPDTFLRYDGTFATPTVSDVTDGDKGDVTVTGGVWFLNNTPQARADLGVRPILASNITFYVDLLGNDVTGDGSAGRPWRTTQHALNVLSGYDLNGNNIAVQLNDGTYAGPSIGAAPIGSGSVTWQGNPSDSSLVVVNEGTNNTAFDLSASNISVAIKNLTINPTSDNVAGIIFNVPFVQLSLLKVNFLSTAGTGAGGCIQFNLNSSHNSVFVGGSGMDIGIQGPWSAFAEFDALPPFNSVTVYANTNFNLVGTPSFSNAFVDPNHQGQVRFGLGTTFSGGATGKRFSVGGMSLIDTNSGGDVNFLPGNLPGVVNPGGLYE